VWKFAYHQKEFFVGKTLQDMVPEGSSFQAIFLFT